MKRRKKNLYFGFGPSKPPKKSLAESRRRFKAGVRQKRKEQDDEFSRLYRSARKSFKGKKKLQDLFHELYGPIENPRNFPGDLTQTEISALRKLLRTKYMAKKRKSKKKRNPGKRRMPAALARYWAKKRAAKARRRNSAKKARKTRRRRNALPRVIVRQVIRYRKPPRRKRRARRNPPRQVPSKINLGSSFTSGQIQKIASTIRRMTGKRTRIVQP